MSAETTTGALGHGPYETEHQARNAPLGVEVRELHDSGRTLHGDSDGLVAATKLRHLTEACTAAGIDLGTYDWRILRWFTTWEPSTIQVFAGIIARAAASGRAEVEQLRAERTELNGAVINEINATNAAMAAVERLRTEMAKVTEERDDFAAKETDNELRVLAAQDEAASLREELTEANRKLQAVRLVRTWTNEDRRSFLFADDVLAALGYGGDNGR